MKVFHIDDPKAYVAFDQTLIREVFHPNHTGLDTSYSIALASLEPGKASEPHALRTSSELYLIMQGHGTVHVGDESREVGKGHIVFIPAGEKQWIENTSGETLSFYCVVSPPWRSEDELPIE